MIGGMGYDEESQSIRGADTSGRRPPPPKPGYGTGQANGGQDDSVQHIVGTMPVKKKKNKKKNKHGSSDDEEKKEEVKEKPVR